MAEPTGIVVFSGEGPHADPWHPLPETTAGLTEILGEDHTVTVVTTVGDLAGRLGTADVLLVNASANRAEPVPDDAVFGEALDGFLAAGGGVLAMHSAAIAFPGLPAWRSALGGVWKMGATFHPPIDRCLITRTGTAHPAGDGLGDFWVHDERYTDLDLVDDGQTVPLYSHTEAGGTHPLVWARTVGNGRVFYDALGHDRTSFDAPEHVELIRRGVAWLGRRG